jgi:transposase InsO family protein
MRIHSRAKLGPAGRLALCEAIERGMTFRQAAACLNVSPATAHRWWRRYAVASLAERHSLAWAADRSSRPHRSPRLLDAAAQEAICEVRRHTGWGPRLVAGETGHPHSTVWKVLHRHGLSRRPRQPRDGARRYEWPCPGDLLHMDTARYARFERPGHRVTGDRSQRSRGWMSDGTRVGYDFAHAIVDDHSRLAYVELLADERAATVTAFVERALGWFETNGIHAKRLMTDNGWSYIRNRSLRELLAGREIKHLRTQAYRPQTNGKVERFHQTMAREWAYGMPYRSSHHREQALPHWLEHYNHRRPHSAIGNRPPISRVHNLRGQDS